MKVRIKKKPSEVATSLYDSGGYLLDNSMANLALYRAANKAAEALPYNSNTYDDGGSLYNTHGGVFTPGNLVFIDEGGTHEQNPYEGVLMGFDQTGTPNLVEEGEVVYNDYVFSNRLSPTKSDLKDFDLANKYHNKTFAKIAENVSKEAMERPNDPIYRKGLEDTLARLAQAQEAQRQRKMLSGTQNLMADGGRLYAGDDDTWNIYDYYRDITPEQYNDMFRNNSHYNAIRQNMIDNWNNVDDSDTSKKIDNFISNYNNNVYGDVNGNVLTRDAKGLEAYKRLSLDDKAGPMHRGILRSATYPPLKRLSEIDKKDENGIRYSLYNQYWGVDNPNDLPEGVNFLDVFRSADNGIVLPGENHNATRTNTNPEDVNPNEGNEGTPSSLNNGEKSYPTYPTWLRYAPAIGSGIQYLQNVFGKPEFTSRDMLLEAAANLPRESVTFTPLNNRMRYMPLDRNLYLNPIRNQASATRRTIANAGQNAGMALANTIASDYNTNNAIGNALTQLADYNNKQRNSVAEFNRATDQYNSQGALSADTTNANLANQREQMRQAYILPAAQYNDQSISAWNDAKGKNFSNLMTNLGNIGRENFAHNQVNSNQALLYYVDENGVSHYAMNPLIQAFDTSETSETSDAENLIKSSYGGKLNSKKRR